MSVFQHPHLTRGIVRTANGAFVISRGRVEMPDEVGKSLGWQPVNPESGPSADTGLDRPRATPRDGGPGADGLRRDGV